ncbi:MAG: TonB-dependent siderophore receptor [Nitrospirales bacterium]|nr:TonB-dependent siderophore receptor [Nitrospirales bacterium]
MTICQTRHCPAQPDSSLIFHCRVGKVWFLCVILLFSSVMVAHGAGQPKEFNIPAQPMQTALDAFAQQSDLQMLYTMEIIEGLQSNAVKGTYSPEQALNLLLEGTGRTFHFADEHTITVVTSPGGVESRNSATDASARKLKPILVPEVVVKEVRDKDYAAIADSTGTKTDTPIIEIPQTINVITRAELDTRLVQTISQAVKYTPGVLTEMYGPVTRDDYFNIRGFDAQQFLDGLGLVGVNYANLRIEPYGQERVEVLKGPASMLYGQSAPGGLVNMTSKRPTEVPLREILLLGGSWNRIQGGLDFGGPIDDQGQFLYRLTGMVRDSDTQVDYAKDNRIFIAPSLTWRPTSNTSFTFLSHWQRDDAGNTLQFLPEEGTLLFNPNGKVPTSRFIGEPDYDRWEREQFTLGYALEHRFNASWKVEQNLRYAYVKTDYPVIFALGFADPAVDLRTVSRLAARYRDKGETFTLDTRLQGAFDTGPLEHRLLLGVDYRYLTGKNRRGFSDAPDLDIYNPVYGQPFDHPNITFVGKQERDQIGLYAQDQVKFHRWLLTGGLRYDFTNSDTKNHFLTSGNRTRDKQDDRKLTYRTALTYLFVNGLAPYFSYSTSFQPQAGTDFSGNAFDPTTGQEYEGGVKFKPVNYDALVTLSAYHLTQQNILTPDLQPGHEGFSVQTGEARVRGFEVEAKANLGRRIGLIGGYSFADSKVTKTNEDNQKGNRLPLTPRHQASLWLDYSFQNNWLMGLNIGSGVRYTGSNFGDLANSLKAPSYTLFDAAVHYDLRFLSNTLKGAELSVNLNNVFDVDYVATCGDGTCYYGNRRTVYGSLRYRF